MDDIITSLQQRFSDGQDIIMKGTALLPSYVITKTNWRTIVQPFLEFYSDESPSCHAVDLSSSCRLAHISLGSLNCVETLLMHSNYNLLPHFCG